MEFVLGDIENIFIGYVKPKLQEDDNQKDFFDVVIQNICKNHTKKTFGEIFHLVEEEMPTNCVGIVKSSDFSLDLRFCNDKKEGICFDFLQSSIKTNLFKYIILRKYKYIKISILYVKPS